MCLRICAVYNQCQIHTNCVGRWMDGKTDRQTDGWMDVSHRFCLFLPNSTTQPRNLNQAVGISHGFSARFQGSKACVWLRFSCLQRGGVRRKGPPALPGSGGGLVCEVPVPAWVPAASLVSGNPERLQGKERTIQGLETLAGHSNTPFAEIGPNQAKEASISIAQTRKGS